MHWQFCPFLEPTCYYSICGPVELFVVTVAFCTITDALVLNNKCASHAFLVASSLAGIDMVDDRNRSFVADEYSELPPRLDVGSSR